MGTKKTDPAKPRAMKYSVRFALRRMGLENEIEALRRYIETVTASIEREFKQFTERLAKQAAFADEETKQLLGEDFAEEASYFVTHFPEFTLRTTFVATYSLLEDELLAIAGDLGRHLKIRLKPDALNDKGIHAAKTYLMTLCGIAFPDKKVPWQQVLHYNRLRNICAHARGRVKKDDKQARNYIKSKSSLTIDANDRIHLTKEFCFEVLDNVKALLLEVLRLVQDRMGR